MAKEPCTYCDKLFTEGHPMDTHEAICPQKDRWMEEAQVRALEQERDERVAAAAAREAAAQREAEEQAMAMQPQRPPTPPQRFRESDGRPIRPIRRPARWLEAFPEPPPPAPPAEQAPVPDPDPDPGPDVQPPPRRWVVTKPNSFGKSIADLCRTSELAEDAPQPTTPWYHPFANTTHALIMEYELLIPKSTAGTNTFLDFMRDPAGDFRQADIGSFKPEHGFSLLDKLAETPPGAPKEGWNTGSVVLRVPPGRPSKRPILEIPITGILFRRPVDIVREAFTTATFERLHTTPSSMRAGPIPSPGQPCPYDAADIELDETGLPALPPLHQELHGEMYHARRTLKQFNELPGCEEEPVIVSLMPFSDGTHLAQFGTAAMQPGYLFLGNQSKYDRAKPSMNTVFHMVYFPKLPDNIGELYLAHYGQRMLDKLPAFLKRELFHLVWELLLDDDFVDAWRHGLLLEKCWDALRRRLFLRISTYGMDYMEKILAATIQFLAKRPCPRCLILKSDIPLTGTVHDLERRKNLRENTQTWRSNVAIARRKIFTKGAAVSGDEVMKNLGKNSFVPNTNAFTRLNDPNSETEHNLFEMFVPDLLHEVELGVFKSVFIHLIRVLYALDKTKVVEFDARFRQVPSFGRMTIRRFSGNVSEMKKLAARDFEDILQCLLPVCEGLFGDLDGLVQTLVFRFQVWHASAKLRLHTTASIERFRKQTKDLCASIRKFARDTESLDTAELPREQAARARKAAADATRRTAKGKKTTTRATPNTTSRQPKRLNLETYKFHCLPDYPDAIRELGTTDSYSTSLSELVHGGLKKMYGKTNRRNFEKQIATQETRLRFMRRIIAQRTRLAPEKKKAALGNESVEHEPEQKRLKLTRQARLRETLRKRTALRRYISARRHHYISDSTRKYLRLSDLPDSRGAEEHVSDWMDDNDDDITLL
ncbi:hypothetical protein MKEN_00834600 [Mycena kentingensis (nom. inval.)]|nr:hypothetical protein MKEN_00834600 [Mycena kentingensis (nom. inval.)]